MNRQKFFRWWAIIATLFAVVFLNTTFFFAARANKYQTIKASDPRTVEAPTNPPSAMDKERLVLAYANLRNAEQVATGELVLSKENLLATGRATSVDDLKSECSAITVRIVAMLPSIQGSTRTETFAYIKNAMMRLTLDREDSHSGHVHWASLNHDKVSESIRVCAKQIQESLNKL